MSGDFRGIDLESHDPNTQREKKETNMYGLSSSFEGSVNFDTVKIKDAVKEPFFTSDNIEKILGERINFDEINYLKYVPTEEANIRIAFIYLAFKANIFLMIFGPTSSAKTYSIYIAYYIYYQKQLKRGIKMKKKEPLRINVSEQTTKDDFIGSIIFDEERGEFRFKEGLFTDAFENGYWLLIDEITLAPYQVLQALEAALDSRRLTVQRMGETVEIEMHKDFFLVCATNPNNKYYQRSNLPKEFLDRFLCTEFENLTSDEMLNIMMKKGDGIEDKNEIQKVINAHCSYTVNDEKSELYRYTLRDLDKAVFLLNRGIKAEKVIDIVYRTRAGEDLVTYNSFGKDPFQDVNTDDFFITESRKKYFQLGLDCLHNGLNIILENEHGEGTSKLAEITAIAYNNMPPIIITMTDELEIQDITRFSVPIHLNGNIEVRNMKGVVYQAMETGRVLIIENLEIGKTKVIEALNDIYECNLLEGDSIKIVRNIKVHKNFRIIFILHSNVIHKLSPAFLNRFIQIKMKPTKEIYNYFNIKAGLPINIFSPQFPEIPDVSSNVEYLTQDNNKIAHTSQIETFYALTKQSVEKQIPICISSEIGYGVNLGMHLYLDEKYGRSKIHDFYCTSETSVEHLIGKHVFEGELVFQIGELLQAAINGEIIIFHGIDKLSRHTFSYIQYVLNCVKDVKREFIIPGYDVSKYKFSKDFRCLATIDINNAESKDINYILKYFHVLPHASDDLDDKKDYRKGFPKPNYDDYMKICQLNEDLVESYSPLLDPLIKCFLLCYEKRNVYDTTFRMFNRMINNIQKLCFPDSPIEQAISIFALFQNVNDHNINDLLTTLSKEISFNYTNVEELLKSDVKVMETDDKTEYKLTKGLLSIPINISLDNENVSFKEMSTGRLDATFHLMGIHSPTILVGPTSYKEHLLKDLNDHQNFSVLKIIKDSSFNEVIGGISIKKNHQQSGEYEHGEIFDLLIRHMRTLTSIRDQINDLDLHSGDSLNDISAIIDEMEDGTLKPYFQYLYDIILKECQYATFFELGFVVRELLLGNSILIKNVDELKESIIDGLIPFLNDSIMLKDCLPDDFGHLSQVQIKNPSIFFTCSEEKYNKLPAAFRSRVQAVHIKNITKDDLKQCVNDINLLNAYDSKIKDYSDMNRAINVIKIAEVLDNYNTPEERIDNAYKIIILDQSVFGNEEKLYDIEQLIEYDKNTKKLISKRTGASLHIKINDFKDKNKDIDIMNNIIEKLKDLIFVPSLASLVDYTIISLATHIPLIIVSSPGQAKSEFIRNFGEAINKHAEVHNMSKNKSQDEYSEHIAPSEDGFEFKVGSLYEKLDKDEIFQIDELNLASDELLSFFLKLFKAPYDSNFDDHLNTKEIKIKKKLNFIATMNPANVSARRSYLPTGFTSCSIVYQMQDYTIADILYIMKAIFTKYTTVFEDYEKTFSFICDCHAKAMKESNDVTIRDLLKLNEILQSCQTKDGKISNKKIVSYVEIVYSSKMVNCQNDFNDIITKYLGPKNMKKIPDFVIKEQYLLKKKCKTALKKTNRVLYIIGPSGCGKNKVIEDLANRGFDGEIHNVFTVQLCHESDDSEFLGRYEPKYSDQKKKLDEFILDLKLPKLDRKLTSNQETILAGYIDELSETDNNVVKTIEKIKNNSILMENKKLKDKIKKFEKDWKQNISFKYIESLLVKAMISGDWVVLDNINLCSGDILESLNSFLEEKHILRLPNGESYGYKNEEGINPIREGFKLILISNDQISDENHIIPAPFLSRCIIVRANKPENHDLAIIGSNFFNISYYSEFMSKCFFDDTKSHVRDIIRMAKICKFIHQNGNMELEDELGKSIKFILNYDHNYNIPDEYKNKKKDGVNIYKSIISTIQTNLIDNTLEDNFFLAEVENDSKLAELKGIFQSLKDYSILNELFKETLRLACYIFSTTPFPNHGDNYTIQEKLITFLLCAYMITSNPKKKVPDFVWDLKFLPSVWDFIFIARNDYSTFTTLDGFKEFMILHSSDNFEFACEFFNCFHKNIRALSDKMEEEIDEQINAMFRRTHIERINDPLLNHHKNKIEIEKLPIAFPSIPNNKIVLDDSLSYSEIIELLNWLDIMPSLSILKIFNYDLEEKTIFNLHRPLFHMDMRHSKIYDILLTKYDHLFKIFKEIFDIPENKDELYATIKEICKKYPPIKFGDLSSLNSDFLDFCKRRQNECDLTKVILEVLLKAQTKIRNAYNVERIKNDVSNKQNENYTEAFKILTKVQNTSIREHINKLMESTINNDKLKEIIKLGIIDKYIMSNNDDFIPKYLDCPYLSRYNCLIPNRNVIELSIILAKFIIPAKCNSFQISNDLYKKIKEKLSTTEVQKLLDDIRDSFNKEDIDYTFLERLLKEFETQPISMLKLNNTDIISNIIHDMNTYHVDYLIALDPTQAKKYIQLIIDRKPFPNDIPKDYLSHLLKDQKNSFKEQYLLILKEILANNEKNDEEENSSDLKITIDLLKERCPAIPIEDYGHKTFLKYDEPNEGNSIAQLAHFLTDQETKKLQIDKKEIISFKIDGQNYQRIPIESMILNLVYISIYEKIEKSVASQFNLIDQLLIVLNPKSPYEMLKKDVIMHLSKINKDEINEFEKQMIHKNANIILSSENLDINNEHLNILYNEDYRKRIVQYENIRNEFMQIENDKNHISKIIDHNLKQIEESFKYLIKTKTIKDIRASNDININEIIHDLAAKILTPLKGFGNGYKIVKITPKTNGKIIEEACLHEKIFSKLAKNSIYSKESLEYDHVMVSESYNTIIKCYKNHSKYTEYAYNIKQLQFNQLHMCEIFINNVIECPNPQVRELCKQMIISIKKIQDMTSQNQLLEKPTLQKIAIDSNLDPNIKFSDLLIIGNADTGAKLLNELDYQLGNCMYDSTLRINMFNITNTKIRTEPITKIRQFDDQIIIQTKITDENQTIKFIDDSDGSDIGCVKFNATFAQPKIYLRFSHPVKMENNSMFIKGEIDQEFSIDVFTDSSSMHYIFILNEIESEFTQNQIETHKISISDTNEKIIFSFKKPGKFKAQMSMTFPQISFQTSAIFDIEVKNEQPTFMYKLDYLKNQEKCKPRVNLHIPSFIAIKSPDIPQCSGNIDLYSKIHNKEYLHLAYVKNNSSIKILNYNVDFVFQPSYFKIFIDKSYQPQLTKFKKARPYNCAGRFEYYNNQVILIMKEQSRKQSYVQLYYENDKLKCFVFKSKMTVKLNEPTNYSTKGISCSNDDQYKLLLKQIKEQQNVSFDFSRDPVIPWINIIQLFDQTKDELCESMIEKVSNDFTINNKETYFAIIEDNKIKPVENIPLKILSNKKISATNRKIIDVKTEKFNLLKTLNYDNLFEILDNLDTIKSALQLYRQIYEYDVKMALNIFKIYQVLKSLGENGIMHDTLKEVISIGNILFNSNSNLSTVEVIYDKNKTKSEIIMNFKKNKLSNYIYDGVSSSIYGHEPEKFKDPDEDDHSKLSKFERISTEEILEFNNFDNLYEIFTKEEPIKKVPPATMKPTETPKDEMTEGDNDEEIMETEILVGQVDEKTKEIDESKYPEFAYKKSISENSELYEISSLEKENVNCFIPKDAELVDGTIPNLDIFVFNVIERLIQSNFSIYIPNQHITILIDISHLSGSGYQNELFVNMMVSMHVLTAFEIPFSVWIFSCRNLCFCAKVPNEEFDNKRQCFIRDAYFLQRINPNSYVLSAIDTVTRLSVDKYTNLFIIFSTFVSSQTLRPYDEWKQKALERTGNKHIICLLEPYQHKCKDVDETLKNTVKDSDLIHVIKYTNVCKTVKELMTEIFSLSKNFSKGSQSLKTDILDVPCHKFNAISEFDDDFICYKKAIDIHRIRSKDIELKKMQSTIINGDFENINTSAFDDFGDINYIAPIMPLNKATKNVLSTHGYSIEIKGLIKSYLSKFTNLKIFKQKTGDKIRDYCADILIDCSNMVKMYSVDHCFISVLSILFSLKDLNIPYVNLVIVGKHLVKFLINGEVKYVLGNISTLSKLYSLIIEEASATRLFEEGVRQLLGHILDNSISHVMFIITDALIGQEHEEKIKEVLSIAYINMVKVIGIGTGPAPYRIENIFALSVYAKNPYKLRQALYKLIQMPIKKNAPRILTEITNYPPMQCESNTNEALLEPFAKTKLYNERLLQSINQESTDKSKLKGDYAQKSNFDLGVNGLFKEYKVLVMMFYEGDPDTADKNITQHTFEHGPEKDKDHEYITSPADKLKEKGFRYTIVKTYKDTVKELLSGEYSIAIVATCSDGFEGNEQNDPNYLEPFLNAIVSFYHEGGSLILFGENPPFIFEVNLILQRLPGINVMFDETNFEEGGKVMHASDANDGYIEAGYFQGPEYKFNAEINGSMHEDIPSIGAGILSLGEGKTLAIFITTDGSKIEDSFRIFSKTSSGRPACIFKVPKGREGALFIDNGGSKLFNDYIEEGAPRLVSNLSIGCVFYSHFRESHLNNLGIEPIKIKVNEEQIVPRATTLMKVRPPLLITILLDATDSMQPHIDKCKKYLKQLVAKTMQKVTQLKIYFQIIAYRDFSENEQMVEPYPITDSLVSATSNIGGIKAFGGCDPNENISIGFETALRTIDEFKKRESSSKHIFILVADSPNHDEDINTVVDGKTFYGSDVYIHANKDGVPWKDVWLHIDEKMKELDINKLACIAVKEKEDDFTKYQYKNWEKYGCAHINKIVRPYTIQTNSFDDIFVNNISDEVKLMYKSSYNGDEK
ncbi:hypothetical protein M9Y10_045811 [Tritrichomonas musculus]|uniref:AAA+ ATPase domain-containing protein n=1 Tax=Tritrichomonas musculus TaxID=1915356 RepID=A0ABR2JWG1_9EUKA